MKSRTFKTAVTVFLFALICQSAFPVILLKRGDTNASSVNLIVSSKTTQKTSTSVSYPVSADIIDSELGIFFSSSIGIATVSIVDSNGNVIDSATVDTSINTEVYLPVDGYESGSYQVKITYNSILLVGDFVL